MELISAGYSGRATQAAMPGHPALRLPGAPRLGRAAQDGRGGGGTGRTYGVQEAHRAPAGTQPIVQLL